MECHTGGGGGGRGGIVEGVCTERRGGGVNKPIGTLSVYWADGKEEGAGGCEML